MSYRQYALEEQFLGFLEEHGLRPGDYKPLVYGRPITEGSNPKITAQLLGLPNYRPVLEFELDLASGSHSIKGIPVSSDTTLECKLRAVAGNAITSWKGSADKLRSS